MIYLDNAATSGYKPPCVVDSVKEALVKFSANPGRGGYLKSMECSEKIYEVRKKLNAFFNGYGSEFVSFTSNCTEALNKAIKGILKKGDHVVVSCYEHNSVLRPLQTLKNKGFCDYAIFNVGATDDETAKNFEAAVKPNTRLCIITEVSNVFGVVLPLNKLSRIAKKHDILFFVDGAQGAGVLPLNMKKIGIDCLLVPGHKGLLGPMGTGAIIHNNLNFEPLIEGGTGTRSFSLEQPETYPERLESGTLNVPGIIGLGAGIDYLKKTGIDNIFNKEFSLCKFFFDELRELNGISLYTSDYIFGNYAPVVSFNIKNHHSEEIATVLNNKGFCVRGGYHCAGVAHKFKGTEKQGTVRVSPSFKNSKKDLKKLLKILEKICNYKVYMV